MIPVKVVQLPHAKDLPLPFYATKGSSGADVMAALESDICLNPGGRLLIPTGLTIEMPEGYELQIRSRSGLAYKHGVMVLNSPATIDNDFRGEIKVLLCNQGQEPFVITRGMRIAQFVIAPYTQLEWQGVDILSDTYSNRTPSGFGSTGV